MNVSTNPRVPTLAVLATKAVHASITVLTLMAALAALCPGTAAADPNDLTGGVMVAHYVPYIGCIGEDPPPGGWCSIYDPYAISSLEQVVAQVPTGIVPGKLWFILAAWETEEKTWCGTELGFGAYDTDPYYFIEWMPCFPVAGLEIPTTNWPGPGEGTAFVTTGTPWSGNWVPVYSFLGYGYDAGYGATVIPIDVDPPTGFCGFGSCTNPPQAFPVGPEQRGGMGVNTEGIVPQWPVDPPGWACCLPEPPGACAILSEAECLQAGGAWLGEPYTCEPNPCPQPGACCLGGLCQVLLEENCLVVGGMFQGGGTDCEPNPCPAVCCTDPPTSPHGCAIMLEDDCLAIPGYWHPEWTSCEPNPCVIYTLPNQASWGRIKSMYR